jgi:hypothetical protein
MGPFRRLGSPCRGRRPPQAPVDRLRVHAVLPGQLAHRGGPRVVPARITASSSRSAPAANPPRRAWPCQAILCPLAENTPHGLFGVGQLVSHGRHTAAPPASVGQGLAKARRRGHPRARRRNQTCPRRHVPTELRSAHEASDPAPHPVLGLSGPSRRNHRVLRSLPRARRDPRPVPGGSAHHPAWYHNIAAHPDQVWIEFGGRHLRVTPTQLDGDERAQAWQRITQSQPRYASYEKNPTAQSPLSGSSASTEPEDLHCDPAGSAAVSCVPPPSPRPARSR